MSASSSTNNLGADGYKMVSVLADLTVMVGSDRLDYPACRRNPTGFETTSVTMGENSGPIETNSALPSVTTINNAPLFRTGNLNIFAGNTLSVETGAGGIELSTDGNVSINAMGGLLSLKGGASVEAEADVVHLASALGTIVDGGVYQNNSEQVSFKNNVAFCNNVLMGGGLAVGGELYAPHLTTQKQPMTSEPGGATKGNINPLQSFAVASGSSKLAKGSVSPLPCYIIGAPPSSAGWIPINIKMGIPNVPNSPLPLQVSVEAYIQFPKGLRFFSDNAYANNKLVKTSYSQATPNLNVDGGDESDITGPTHTHTYYIPASTLLDGTSSVFGESRAVEGKDLAGNKEMQIDGKSMADAFRDAQKTLMDTYKQQYVDPIKRQAEVIAKGAIKGAAGSLGIT